MAFKDYSATPASNTAVGDAIYIGPNMGRNNVRRVLQQFAADGRVLSDTVDAATANIASALDAANAASAANRFFASKSLGEAGSVTGQLFSYSDGSGGIVYAQRTSSGSTILAEVVTPYYLRTGFGKPVQTLGAGVDNAAAINAALMTAPGVILGEGTFGLSSAVIVPTGKFLIGQGRGRTTLKVLTGFATGSGNTYNAPVCSAVGATDIRFSDFSIDSSKVGNAELILGDLTKRISGLKLMQVDRFHVERVNAKDVSGYAFHAQGLYGGTPIYARRGVFRDIRTENCNVHIEQTCGEHILVEKFYCTDGDGDVPCEAYLHPLEGSRHIKYTNGEISGLVQAAGVALSIAKGAATYGVTDLVVEDVRAVCGGIAIVSGGTSTEPITGLTIRGGSFVSRLNVGTNIIYTTGKVVGTDFEGATIGFQSSNSTINASGNAKGTNPNAGQAAYAVNGDEGLFWEAGLLTAIAPLGTPIPISGTVGVGSGVRKVPADAGGKVLLRRASGSSAAIAGYGGSYVQATFSTNYLSLANISCGAAVKVTGDGYATPFAVSLRALEGNPQTVLIIFSDATLAGQTVNWWADEWS